MTIPRRRLLAAAAVMAALVLGPVGSATAAVPADTSDFSFDSFDAQYHLGLDEGHATLRVVETLVARFPDYDQNRGIIRAIPLKDGEVDLRLQISSVTDEDGDPVYWEREDVNGFAELALGTDEYVHGVQTYVIEYTMRDVIRHFSDSGGDEFYWDVNGDGWQQSFGEVSARVFLPQELAERLTGDAACFSGYYGETDACSITGNEAGTQFDVAVGPVYGFQTLTFSIGFEGGTVVQPPLPSESWVVQIAPKVLFGLALALLLLAIVIRTVLWRDRPGRGLVIAQYTPLPDASMLMDANIVERPASGLQALLVDLAVRGIIKVVDDEPSGSDPEDRQRYSIELIRADGASAQELKVLVILFGASLVGGKRVKPAALSASIGASLYGLPAQTAALAKTEGFRFEAGSRSAQRWLRRALLWTVLLFVPIWVYGVIFDVLEEGGIVWLAVLTAFVAIAASIVLSRPTRLTEKGALAKEHLLGIREYLTIAEEDRLRVLQSPQGALRVDVTDRDAVVKLNERLLGYAVLWGVEDVWVEVLRAQYPSASPDWLEGGTLSTSMLRGFTSASTSSVRPIVTASSSSGSSWSSSGGSSFSSGSSGGGFSGGGGGGGGGGGR